MGHTLRILLVIVAAGISGCATTDKPKEEDRVSSIPWAKPEGWEGQGTFGGMMQGAR